MTRTIRGVILLAGAAALLAGCRDKEQERQYRATLPFYTDGVAGTLDILAANVATRSEEGVLRSIQQVTRAVEGLPRRIEKKATTRRPERLALAQQVQQKFQVLVAQLVGMKYDEQAVRGQIDEIRDLLQDIERD